MRLDFTDQDMENGYYYGWFFEMTKKLNRPLHGGLPDENLPELSLAIQRLVGVRNGLALHLCGERQ